MTSKPSFFALVRNLQQSFAWVWCLAWATNAWLLTGFLGATVLESLLPAALVLAGRRLINSLVAGLHQGNGNSHSTLAMLLAPSTTFQLCGDPTYAIQQMSQVLRKVPAYWLMLGTDLSQIPPLIARLLQTGKDVC